MPTALLIPVKTMGNAKQRLGDAFDQYHRTLLAEAMLRDVLTAVSGVADRVDVFLVTGDPQAQSLATQFKFGIIEDRRNESETAAIEMASGWCEDRGYNATVVIPADIPLITSAELQEVFAAAPPQGAVFVPAYDRRGSNCVLRRPANIIPLRFGNDSFLPHCESMRKTGKPLVILEMSGIGLDIDNPHELELLLQRQGETHSQRLLREWGYTVQSTSSLGAAG
jgi:2-phospho-L-lactate guanylyltransferase